MAALWCLSVVELLGRLAQERPQPLLFPHPPCLAVPPPLGPGQGLLCKSQALLSHDCAFVCGQEWMSPCPPPVSVPEELRSVPACPGPQHRDARRACVQACACVSVHPGGVWVYGLAGFVSEKHWGRQDPRRAGWILHLSHTTIPGGKARATPLERPSLTLHGFGSAQEVYRLPKTQVTNDHKLGGVWSPEV